MKKFILLLNTCMIIFANTSHSHFLRHMQSGQLLSTVSTQIQSSKTIVPARNFNIYKTNTMIRIRKNILKRLDQRKNKVKSLSKEAHQIENENQKLLKKAKIFTQKTDSLLKTLSTNPHSENLAQLKKAQQSSKNIKNEMEILKKKQMEFLQKTKIKILKGRLLTIQTKLFNEAGTIVDGVLVGLVGYGIYYAYSQKTKKEKFGPQSHK